MLHPRPSWSANNNNTAAFKYGRCLDFRQRRVRAAGIMAPRHGAGRRTAGPDEIIAPDAAPVPCRRNKFRAGYGDWLPGGWWQRRRRPTLDGLPPPPRHARPGWRVRTGTLHWLACSRSPMPPTASLIAVAAKANGAAERAQCTHQTPGPGPYWIEVVTGWNRAEPRFFSSFLRNQYIHIYYSLLRCLICNFKSSITSRAEPAKIDFCSKLTNFYFKKRTNVIGAILKRASLTSFFSSPTWR